MMDMLVSTLTGLGISVSERQIDQFETYYRELIAWNDRMNLTAITGYEEVQVKHFLDSLSVILAFRRFPGLFKPGVIDVGTGAGFPGIPLKIVMPDFHLTLLEATLKKTRFLAHLVRVLELREIEVLAGRAEDFGRRTGYREGFGMVLSRAVAALPVLMELALPFCALGGSFIAWKQAEIGREIEQAQNAAGLLGGRLKELIDVNLPGLVGKRCLVIYEKVALTPPAYPRRSGIPAKRPLG